MIAKRNNARLGLVARGHSRPRARIVTLQPHRTTPLCCGHVRPRGKFAATPTGAEQAETPRGRPGERARRYPAGPGRCRPEVTGASPAGRCARGGAAAGSRGEAGGGAARAALWNRRRWCCWWGWRCSPSQVGGGTGPGQGRRRGAGGREGGKRSGRGRVGLRERAAAVVVGLGVSPAPLPAPGVLPSPPSPRCGRVAGCVALGARRGGPGLCSPPRFVSFLFLAACICLLAPFPPLGLCDSFHSASLSFTDSTSNVVAVRIARGASTRFPANGASRQVPTAAGSGTAVPGTHGTVFPQRSLPWCLPAPPGSEWLRWAARLRAAWERASREPARENRTWGGNRA